MYIFKLNHGDGILTYTFQDQSWGKSGDDAIGITTLLGAFKKYYENFGLPASVKIMNENGLYYNPTYNKYIWTDDYRLVTIPLNNLAKKELEEAMKPHSGDEP
jgi:hypothetical protein